VKNVGITSKSKIKKKTNENRNTALWRADKRKEGIKSW
jgi:hypothetical protein